jgi:hypothetical protein
MQNHEKKQKVKKEKIQDFMGKKIFFLALCPSAPR